MKWLGLYVIKEITDGGAIQLVKLNGEPFLGRVNGSQLKPYIGDPVQGLYDDRTVLVLQVAVRERGTINYIAQFEELHDRGVAHKRAMS